MRRSFLKSVLIWLRNYFVFIGVMATVLPLLLGLVLVKVAKQVGGQVAAVEV